MPITRFVVVGLIGLLLAGCFGDKHPDHSRYEYLYINGSFQPPYTAFPASTERGNWKCFDGKTEKVYDCTFVRGGWQFYQYIFREKKA